MRSIMRAPASPELTYEAILARLQELENDQQAFSHLVKACRNENYRVLACKINNKVCRDKHPCRRQPDFLGLVKRITDGKLEIHPFIQEITLAVTPSIQWPKVVPLVSQPAS